MQLSRFTIVSKRTRAGSWVLFHSVSGAVDVVDDDVISGLRAFGTLVGAQGMTVDDGALPPPRSVLTDEEVAKLQDRGYLTVRSRDEELALVPQIADALHEAAAKAPSFLVIPSLDCNYRCTYCFERPLQNQLTKPTEGRKKLNILSSYDRGTVTMTRGHVDALYEAIPKLRARHGDERGAGQIVLYGGEPLDARNEEIVRYIVEQGAARGHRFAVITNGHDIEVFADLFGAEGIQQCQISIDGPKEVHDRRRIHLGGESSYDKVAASIQLLAGSGDTLVQVRTHVDPHNLGTFEELLDDFGRRGWINHPNIVVYANTVYDMKEQDCGGRMSQQAIDERLRHLIGDCDNVLLNGPSINLRAKMLPALLKGLQIPVQGNYCSANTGQYLFSPDGCMYSCWESVGKEESRVGRYVGETQEPSLELTQAKTEEWFGRNVGRIPACSECSMALVCGGGCAQFALYQNGTQRAPYCDSFEYIFRRALADIADTFVARADEVLAGEQAGGLVRANYG